jgi:hypothetical protein
LHTSIKHGVILIKKKNRHHNTVSRSHNEWYFEPEKALPNMNIYGIKNMMDKSEKFVLQTISPSSLKILNPFQN